MKKILLVTAALIALAAFSPPTHAAEFCEGIQCLFQTCSSPTHCQDRKPVVPFTAAGTPTIVTDIVKLDDIGICSRRATLALDIAEYKNIGQLDGDVGAYGEYKKFTGSIRCVSGEMIVVVAINSADIVAANKQMETLKFYLTTLKNW